MSDALGTAQRTTYAIDDDVSRKPNASAEHEGYHSHRPSRHGAHALRGEFPTSSIACHSLCYVRLERRRGLASDRSIETAAEKEIMGDYIMFGSMPEALCGRAGEIPSSSLSSWRLRRCCAATMTALRRALIRLHLLRLRVRKVHLSCMEDREVREPRRSSSGQVRINVSC